MKRTTYSTLQTRVRAVKEVLNGMSVAAVAKAYQTHRSTVHRWVERYEAADGEQSLSRRPASGRPRKLLGPAGADAQWRSIVLKPASTFGYETDFWTCRRLRQVARAKFNTEVSIQTIWRRLREAGLTYQKPERRYFEASAEARKKWIRYDLPRIKAVVKKHRALLYFEDEASISLTAILGKMWAPKGRTPQQEVTGKRGGISAMSAIGKTGRLFFRLHDKRIASAEVIGFLRQILKQHGRRHVVVVMDQAPPHTSKKTRAFIDSEPRLHVFYLPPYSPDWNPDEKVWNHLKHQELKGHQAKTKQEMKRLARRKLSVMQRNRRQMRGVFFRCCVAELLE